MKTDHPIYLFLSAGPEAFRILTGGLRLEGGYRFCSLTIKTLERRLDGILEPEGHEGPVYAIEFMGQPAPGAWYNLLTKIGLYGEQYPQREVTGILIYLRKRDRPARPSWIGAPGSTPFGVSLEQVLPDWLAREPDNPYVAALAPLVIADDATLQARAPALWHRVERASLPQAQRDLLAQVLEFWFFERFRGLTAKEIWALTGSIRSPSRAWSAV